MFITPADLIPDALRLDESIPATAIDYAPDVRQVSPLHLTGTADRIEEHRGPPRHRRRHPSPRPLRRRPRTALRTLSHPHPTTTPTRVSTSSFALPRPTVTAVNGQSPKPRQKSGIMRRKACAWKMSCASRCSFPCPDRSLCQPACKGLCPHCGENRNETNCTCESKSADPRWSALARPPPRRL